MILILILASIVPAYFMISMTGALYSDARQRGSSVVISCLFGALGPFLAAAAMALVASLPTWLY